ncbi:MAG: transposase [Actinomycetota bacterium]
MLHAGVDMHKRFSVVTVVDDDGNELCKGERLDNDEGAISSFFEDFGEDIQVVLEAGPSWQWMCDLLDGLGLDNKLCHPLKTRAIASAKIKTDKIDSGILAHLSRLDFIPEAHKAAHSCESGHQFLSNADTSGAKRRRNPNCFLTVQLRQE